MDEVTGLIVEQIAKRFRERGSRSASGRGTATPGVAVGIRAPAPPAPRALSAGEAARASSAATAAPPGRSSAPGPRAPAVRLPAERAALDPFSGAASAAAAFAEPPEALPPLLQAFSSGPSLLAAIVLSEALAPPAGVQPFDARKR